MTISHTRFLTALLRESPAAMRCLIAAVAAFGLIITATSSSHAQQALSLGTAESFAILGGSAITNTGATTISGNVGVYPGTSITGFGTVTLNGASVVHNHDAVAQQAQADDTTAYNALAGLASLTSTRNLSGQNLGGQTLTAGVYDFSASAQLTGALTLNGQGNPNSVFIIIVGSALTTASASSIVLENGAKAGNVFFVVGSSATLGTSTAFAGDILALTSITLNTGATIECGAAWAQNGAVTLNNNTITACTTSAISGSGLVTVSSILPPWASGNQRAVGNGIDAYLSHGGTLPLPFLSLIAFSSPSQLAAAFTQLSGESSTGTAQAGTQAMNSFLSTVINPFGGENRPFADEAIRRPLIVKGPLPADPVAPEPRRWGVWAATYGGEDYASGDVFGVGSHDRSISTFGYITGLDYLVTPNTVAGFALGGGETRFGLLDGLGGGHSDMAQAAVYASTRINAAYLSAALAYAYHQVSTERSVNVAGLDNLAADFSANNVGGRLEGGYRFALPYVGLPGRYGFTPYAAVQAQSFFTPYYAESAISGSSTFALAYNAHTTTTTRTEIGDWFDWSMPAAYDSTLVLSTRTAWAHDYWSAPNMSAMFEALPGSNFTVTGASPPRDLLLASTVAEVWFKNGFSFALRFDGEFAEHAQKYVGTGELRYRF